MLLMPKLTITSFFLLLVIIGSLKWRTLLTLSLVNYNCTLNDKSTRLFQCGINLLIYF